MDYDKLFEIVKKSSVDIKYKPADKALPVGVSKFGGKPHLPKDFVWPYYEGKGFGDVIKNRPLSFLAQINLQEVKQYDKDKLLPENGMLYFFYELETMEWGYNIKHKGSARVYYYENIDTIQELDFPDDLDEDYIIPEFQMIFSSKDNVPDFQELEIQLESLYSEYPQLMADFDEDKYTEECEECEYIQYDSSKLLGYADLIQGLTTTECELVANGYDCGTGNYQLTDEQEKLIEENSKEWILLCQMSGVQNDDYELMFGDCGSIYFYIKKSDLKNRNFQNVWTILQCS